MTARSGRPGPRRADIADGYDRGVDAYDALWSPVILPPATALVPLVVPPGQPLVADVGGGTGALLGAIRAAAPRARVVTLDASAQMLRAARARRGASAVVADALALPFPDRCVDAVILAYVLFHVADPWQAVAEVARVLRPGGRAGAITWGRERTPRADAVWDRALTGAGVPPAPVRRNDVAMGTPAAVAALLRSAGLTPERTWPQQLQHQWDRSSYWELATGWGPDRARLNRIDASARGRLLDRVRADLDRLDPADFLWEGEVICAVAAKDGSA